MDAYKYIVILECIEKLTQKQSRMITAFDDAAAATYDYMEQCGKYMSDNCEHTAHAEDNDGFMTDTYEDQYFVYTMELHLEENGSDDYANLC